MYHELLPNSKPALLPRIPTLVLLALLLALLAAQMTPAAAHSQPVVTAAPVEADAAQADLAQTDAGLAVAWFDLALTLVKETPGYTPPVASRAFGYLGVTLYETVRPGVPGARTLAGQLNQLYRLPRPHGWAEYHWPSAANAALAAMTRLLFPTAPEAHLAAIDALEDEFAQRYQAEVDRLTYRRSAAWGQTMADAIYAWSMRDGGHRGYANNFPTEFVAPIGEGMWVPTPPKFAAALQPTWGSNRPFVLPDGDGCPSVPPHPYSEATDSVFYAEAMEVYAVVSAADPAQVEIARFWADDPGKTATPPGHWVSILNQVLVQEEASLVLASEAYAKVGIAVADSFITCWYTKFQYNVPRPITYIQQVIDPSWNTPEVTDPVGTPPFPEYTSGHSVQSAAAARVLTALFGEEYAFVDHTHAGLGMGPRSFGSFAEAAQEAAVSRLYGGIHFRAAIEHGLAQGECVGERVLGLRFFQ